MSNMLFVKVFIGIIILIFYTSSWLVVQKVKSKRTTLEVRSPSKNFQLQLKFHATQSIQAYDVTQTRLNIIQGDAANDKH